MIGLKQDISTIIEGLERKKKELEKERLQYKKGCPYEIYLGGVIQGIFYALNYPVGCLSMRKIESESHDHDKLIWVCTECTRMGNTYFYAHAPPGTNDFCTGEVVQMELIEGKITPSDLGWGEWDEFVSFKDGKTK